MYAQLRNGGDWATILEQTVIWDGSVVHLSWDADRHGEAYRLYVTEDATGVGHLVRADYISPPGAPDGLTYVFVWDGVFFDGGPVEAAVGSSYTVRVDFLDMGAPAGNGNGGNGGNGDNGGDGNGEQPKAGMPTWMKMAAAALILTALTRS